MCKYCNSGKEHQIVSYDNTDAMNVSFGQYHGVYGSLTMKGDMLMLSGSGSYRSHSDCYYEDNGVECDNECSQQSKPAYVKIKFCPFCGKKLDSHEYEKRKTRDEIKRRKKSLKMIKNKLDGISVLVSFTFETTNNNYVKAENIVWPENKSGTKVPLETLILKFGNLTASVEYMTKESNYIHRGKTPKLDFDKGIRFHYSEEGKFFSYTYSLDEMSYGRLVDMGIIKKDEGKLKKVADAIKTVQEKIDKEEYSIKKLTEKLNTL